MCEETLDYCEAVFDTGGTTCNTHCESFGLVCVEGWDEKDGDCASKLTDDSRRVGNGCDMVYWNQICRCYQPGMLILVNWDIMLVSFTFSGHNKKKYINNFLVY